MPYIARTRLKVGDTGKVIGQEPKHLRYKGMQTYTAADGSTMTRDLFEPEMGDVMEPLYRNAGELVPEAEDWDADVIDRLLRNNMLAVAPEQAAVPERERKPRRSGTVKAES